METLKVTTLPLLIAFTWLTSEVVAYPQLVKEIDPGVNDGAGRSCGRSWVDHPEIREQNGKQIGLSDTLLGLIAPPNTSSHHTDRSTRDDACSFDIAPNETPSLEVAR